LKSCFELSEANLQASPICPHCTYRPANEPVVRSVSEIITDLDDELDFILLEWGKSLLENLDDPTAKETISCSSRSRSI